MPHKIPVQMDRQMSTIIKENLNNLMRDDDSDSVEFDSGSDNSRRSSYKQLYTDTKKGKSRQNKYCTDERTVYVADLLPYHTDKDLVDVFRPFGDLAKVVKTPNTPYGYVTFERLEAARNAVNKAVLHIDTHPIRVMPYMQPDNSDPNANLIIKNLEVYTTEKDIMDRFKQFGEVLSCKVVRDANGQSKCFAFLQYKTVISASLAIDALNNTYWEEQMDPDKQFKKNKSIRNGKNMHSRVPVDAKGKKIYVGVFKKREEYLKAKSEKEGKPSNLYVKNLGDKFNDHDLYELFKPYGCIKSAKIRRFKETNRPMGCGFVDFENPDDSERAIAELDGHVLHKFDHRVITVKYAECKSRRVKPLQSTKNMVKQSETRIFHDIHNNSENNSDEFDMNQEYTSTNLSAINNNYSSMPFTLIENRQQQQQQQQQQQIPYMEFCDLIKSLQTKSLYSLF